MNTAKMDVDARVKLTIGTQFVEIQILQDRVDELTQQLADCAAQVVKRDAEIADLKKRLPGKPRLDGKSPPL